MEVPGLMSVGQFFSHKVSQSVEIVAVQFDVVVTSALEKNQTQVRVNILVPVDSFKHSLAFVHFNGKEHQYNFLNK